MKSEIKMTKGEITAMLNNFSNSHSKISEASGAVVAVELKMRLIGEISREVQKKLKDLPKKYKKDSSRYWDCKLEYLDEAIDEVFSKSISKEESELLRSFRKPRNKILHGDFIGLLKELNILPTGRNISNIGTRNILKSPDIKEAILSMERNRGFEKMREISKNTENILDKIIYSLGK